MNPRLLNLLDGDTELYPHVLEARFQRVFNKLVELWQTPHIDDYLRDLMVDKRGGEREGFPPDAAAEIMRLIKHRDKLYLAQNTQTNWDDVPEFKRQELRQYGYDFSANGLLKAVEDNHGEAVYLILSCGVNLEGRDERGWTPLMLSACNGNLKFVQHLVKCGARISTRDNKGYTPLHWAAYNGHVEVLKFLLDRNAEVNLPNQFGWTALMQAATRGHLFACAYLLSHGAAVNATSSDGWTSLHKAAQNGHAEVVKLLLSKGANSMAKLPDGSLPFDVAARAGHQDIVTLLSQHMAARGAAASGADSLRLQP